MTLSEHPVFDALRLYLNALHAAEESPSLATQGRVEDARLALGQVLRGGRVVLWLPMTISVDVNDYGA